MTVRGYIRVSTADQAEGYSLQGQRGKIEAWAAYQGLTAPTIYEDAGLSGRRDDRPGLTALLLDLRSGDVVVTYSLSRLARGGAIQLLRIVGEIRERGARIVFLTESIDTETPTGRLMLTILAALAELEIEQTRERTEMGRTEAAAQGIYPHAPGSLPTGWTTDSNGRIVEHPEHAQTVRAIFAQGNASYAAIARHLTEQGAPTPRGGKWTFVQIGRIISDESYSLGYITYRAKTHPDAPERHVRIPAPALITPEQWRAAQRTRNTNHPHKQPHLFPLSGHLRCECGAPLNGRNPAEANRLPRYVCYPRRRGTPTCPTNGGVTRIYANAERIGQTARAALAAYLTDPDDPARLAALYATPAPDDPHAQARADIDRKLAALVDLYLEQLIDRGTYEQRRATLQAQQATLAPKQAPTEPDRTTLPELAQIVLNSDNLEFAELLHEMKADLIIGPGGQIRVLHAAFPAG